MADNIKSLRRTFLKVAGVGAVGLVACGDDDIGADAGTDASTPDVANGPRDASIDSMDQDATVPAPTGRPRLRNFRVEDANRDRIYFDTDTALFAASDVAGFFLGDGLGVTITSVSANLGDTAGHYFTLSSALSFWDNNALRYEGGSDFAGSDSLALYPFTLEYVQNNITEPEAATDRFVSTAAAGGGDGTSEATAWTLEEALGFSVYEPPGDDGSFERTQGQARPGMTVWVKAGDYGDRHLALVDQVGTADAPLKIIGYKDVPGDITSNYIEDYDGLTNEWDANEMPTLTGKPLGSRDVGDVALQLENVEYLVIRNLQLERYAQGIQSTYRGKNRFVVLDNINGRDFLQQPFNGDEATYGYFINLESRADSDNLAYTYSDHCKFTNIVGKNANLGVVYVAGDGGNLFRNVKAYNDVTTNERDAVDYFLAFNGSNNVAIDNHVEGFGYVPDPDEDALVAHGIGVRGSYNWQADGSHYNLIADSTAGNCAEGFYIRNMGCSHNVIKRCRAYRTGLTMVDGRPDYFARPAMAGVMLMGGVDDNIVEDVVVTDHAYSVLFFDNQEDNSEVKHIGSRNIIRNCVFVGSKECIQIDGFRDLPLATLSGNKVINCTLHSGFEVATAANVEIDEFEFINCQITNFHSSDPIFPSSDIYPTDKLTFKNCNFWNNTGDEVDNWFVGNDGELNIGNANMDPQYRSNTDLHLQPVSPSADAGLDVEGLYYDMDGAERVLGEYSIGAFEETSE